MIQYSYYILFLIVFFLFFLDKNSKTSYFTIAVLFVGIISSLRYGFGADYFAYQSIYVSIPTLGNGLDSVFEPFYILYNQLLISLGVDYWGFIAFNTMLLMTFIVIWIQTSSNYRYRSFFVYISFFFLVWNLSTFRQSMALSLGVMLLYNKQFNFHLVIKLLIVLILAMFHVSAFFIGVLLILGSFRWKRNYHIIFFIVGLLFTLLPTKELITFLINHPTLDYIVKIAKFRLYFNGMEYSTGFLNINSLMRIFFFGLIWFHYEQLTKTKYLKFITDIFLSGMTLYFFLSFNALLASRLTIYALFLLVILLPEILFLYEEDRLWIRIITISIFISLCTFMYFKDLYAIKGQLGINDGKWYVEYQSIIDQPKLSE